MTTVSRRRTARSIAAEAAFRARVEELGGVVLGEYVNSRTPVRCRCTVGHECFKRPHDTIRHGGICRICSGKDPGEAERRFRSQLAELGAVLLEPRYLGARTPHRILCAEGHPSAPTPTNISKGQGICRACLGTDTGEAERRFRSQLAELGAVLLEPRYLGATTPHRILCAEGHPSAPTPTNVDQRGTICRVCAGRDSQAAWESFRARVAELGGTVLEPEWLGNNRPHRVRCVSGHDCTPHPSSVQQGDGICRVCAGKVWDVFYVVTGMDADGRDCVKFGITSGDPRPRLARHERDGYDVVVRLLTGLPDGVAPAVERAALAALRLAGVDPVRGREYFDGSALRLVLDIVDNYPIRAASTAPAA